MLKSLPMSSFLCTIFLVLLFCSHHMGVDAAGGHSCIFDSVYNRHIAVARELPMRGKNGMAAYTAAGGDGWEPIRIVTSQEDLNVQGRFCNEDANRMLVSVPNFRGGQVNCRPDDILTDEKRRILRDEILPKAIALHTERLRVQRGAGNLVVPQIPDNSICKHFTVPQTHHTDGVENADMVLYISGAPIENDDTVAWAVPCATIDRRPIAGALNYRPKDMITSRHSVRSGAHEIAHALGFGYSDMLGLSMITQKNVRGKPDAVAVVTTDAVKAAAQRQYGCSTLEGMELEDTLIEGEKQSHWERRNAKDELMAPFAGDPGTMTLGLYTELTLAAFESMKFYKANYSMAEHMEWGYKAGCDLLEKKCMEEGVTKYPGMFCKEREDSPRCSTDRLGLGVCAKGNYEHAPLPDHFRYFADPTDGGAAHLMTDYCPVIAQVPFWSCTDSGLNVGTPGSRTGKDSWCVDAENLVAKMNGHDFDFSGVCAEISCADGVVRVRYDGDDSNWHECPEGGSLAPSSTSTFFTSGVIKCPKYEEVCTVGFDGSSLVATNRKKVSPINPTSPPTSSSSGKDGTGRRNDKSTANGCAGNVAFSALAALVCIIFFELAS